MKQQLLLIFGFCMTLFFASCEKEESSDDTWRIDNETWFAKMSTDTEYTRINSASSAGYIMYKTIKSGDGPSPYFTDQVKVLYTGYYKYDWSKPDTYIDEKGKTITNKIIFDSTDNRNGIPSKFYVRGVVDGFATALQHMKVGEKCEVWIPWKLAYGASGSGSIPGHTMLVFEIELVEIID